MFQLSFGKQMMEEASTRERTQTKVEQCASTRCVNLSLQVPPWRPHSLAPRPGGGGPTCRGFELRWTKKRNGYGGFLSIWAAVRTMHARYATLCLVCFCHFCDHGVVSWFKWLELLFTETTR